jgi:hypothetical protein
LSQVGYFYGGDCEGYCLLACDSSVEASMIVVEEKLLGEKTVWYMRKGEQNETKQQVYTALSARGVQNTSFLRITAMLCCTGDSVPSFGLYSKNWSMLISSKLGIISDPKTYYLLYKFI